MEKPFDDVYSVYKETIDSTPIYPKIQIVDLVDIELFHAQICKKFHTFVDTPKKNIIIFWETNIAKVL